MKKLMLSTIALLSAAGLGSALQAQDPGAPPPPVQDQDPAMPTDAPPPPPAPPPPASSPVVTDSTPDNGALTPPPPEAMNKTYPVCSKTVQDNCRNRGGV